MDDFFDEYGLLYEPADDMDIYNKGSIESQMENGQLSLQEAAFMQGYNDAA